MDFVAVAGAIVVIGGALAALTKWVLAPLFRGGKKISMFLDDFFGEPAREGVDARPGLMARVASIERSTESAKFHLGNGNPVPLRDVVEAQGKVIDDHTKTLARIDRATKEETS